MTKLEHAKIPFSVIPEPEQNTRTVFVLKGPFPVFKGKGDVDRLCGKCGQVLVEGGSQGFEYGNLVIKCQKCGSFNEIAHT